ncbi:MAG: crotonobetainyl-CoA:carnitine CoA-transferase CaiB-like acyl-CoA transferase [Candidatus Aldehydirespiratoraceae bacterium]|jgi:crotonobetainyl-CoA:carnitine CoA-transferase CaiB-like acyl-CoA transferase
MRLGDIANAQPSDQPRPLEGIRVLAAEQMAALPFATQLLARLGAEVVKVEHPTMGDSGRGSVPFIEDPDGRKVGATFLRNNFSKKSIGLDLKAPDGVDLFLDLAPKFDIVCENFRAGTADRLGIGYKAVVARHPEVVYLSVSGFGNDPASPYMERAAYAAVVEAMSGIYEYKRRPGRRPMANPVGALGDISSALFGVIGILAALRHRDRTGQGQYIDIAMLDATMAMTDIVANFYSMGIPDENSSGVGIVETFEAGEGNFVLQIVREHHFEKVAEITGNSAWLSDERFASRAGWQEHFEDIIRPGIEGWAADKTNREAVNILSGEGIAAGESNSSREIVEDEHVAVRNMLVEMPHPNGGDPILVPGNPVKMSRTAEGPETRVPWLGEHTDEVLAAELGLDADRLAELHRRGVVS